MLARDIVVSPDLVIRIHAYPSRRQRALRAQLPKAVAALLGTFYLLLFLVSA
jgi:hypothetical protein